MAVLKDLIVHGSSRFLNKIYASQIQAEEGHFNKLMAKDLQAGKATVIGLLDVKGQMHTNSWTNSNIATIDGSFYITPTISSSSGNVTLGSNKTQATFTGAWTAMIVGEGAVTDTSEWNFGWSVGSKVLVTGEILVENQWMPLGTLKAVLKTALNNSSVSSLAIDTITDNKGVSPSPLISEIYETITTTTVAYRNLKISMYQRADGNNYKPLGIYLTALGERGKTFIDVYGGVENATTNYGGFAIPNVRIGNLNGLPNTDLNGNTPKGWGIYTNNGYFTGVLVSSVGKIANFTINGSKLYSNNHSAYNTAVSGIYIGDDYISFGSGGVTYFNTSGTGKVGPWTLTASALYNTKSSYNNSNAGVYIGTDYIAGGAGEKWWLKSDGSAKIGSMTLSAAGVLTVPAAQVSGELTAATISGANITSGTIEIGKLNTAAQNTISNAANTALSYITLIDANGIWITPSGKKPSNTSTGAGATGVRINANGMEIFKGGTSVANYGDDVRIGENGKYNVFITEGQQGTQYPTAGTYIIDSSSGVVAKFGQTVQIGDVLNSHLTEDFHSIQLVDKEGYTYFHVSDLRDATGYADITEYFIGDGTTDNMSIHSSISSNLVVKKNDIVLVRDTDYTISSGVITFATTPASGDVITASYKTADRLAKAYTFGFRKTNSTLGLLSVAEGRDTIADGYYSHAEGYSTTASGFASHAEGDRTLATNYSSHAEGISTKATGMRSHAEGNQSKATNDSSHAEGDTTTSSGWGAHAEGGATHAYGDYAHAEGYGSEASGNMSHAESGWTTASGSNAHAEGQETTASGTCAHAEGYVTEASGKWSHAEGYESTAGGYYSHAQNRETKASSDSQTALGKYNVEDTNNKYAAIIGNGTADDARSDALRVDWDGNVEMALNTSASSGTTDYDLYAAITALNWGSEVIVT